MTTRRDTLKGVAMLAAADKVNDGGFEPVSLPGKPERGVPVLPPGAVSRERFASKCIGCGVCIAACPEKVLKPSVSLRSFGQPELDFREGHCLLGCVRCTRACPIDALEVLQPEMKPNVHIGEAVWRRDLCVRTVNGDECTACVRKCPVQAIHLVQGFPVVDRTACIGCGACEHVCPSRPEPAIHVKGFDMQRIVKPVSEEDLLREMHARLDAGASVVTARDGVIRAVEEGRGIGPLLKLYDAGELRRTVVLDKVIGRAAAAICAMGGVKKVHTLLAGEGAAEILAAKGIVFVAAKTVPRILNHAGDGSCPMENAVQGLDDPGKMIEAIRKAMKK